MANIKKREALNRLRVVFAKQDKTNRRLAEQLGKTEYTIPDGAITSHNLPLPS